LQQSLPNVRLRRSPVPLAQLLQRANTLLKQKVMFGSDYPLLTPDRWLADFEKLPMRDEVRPPILKENALRSLGLRAVS
jgi:uncharacterized protein